MVGIDTPLGETNFRGTYQELNIKELRVPYEFFNSSTLSTLKADAAEQEELEQKFKIPMDPFAGGRIISFAFQNGVLKNNGVELSDALVPPLDTSADYCTIWTIAKYSKLTDSVIISGISTLTYGQGSFGPITFGPTGAKPGEGFENSQFFLRMDNFGSSKWQQFNKALSGRNDVGNIKSLECTTHTLEAIKVSDLQKALGIDQFTITYSVGNSLEVYLDNQFGLHKYLKGSQSPKLK